MIFYWYFVINLMTFNFVIRDYTIFKLILYCDLIATERTACKSRQWNA